jgi:hypothetical protein
MHFRRIREPVIEKALTVYGTIRGIHYEENYVEAHSREEQDLIRRRSHNTG